MCCRKQYNVSAIVSTFDKDNDYDESSSFAFTLCPLYLFSGYLLVGNK